MQFRLEYTPFWRLIQAWSKTLRACNYDDWDKEGEVLPMEFEWEEGKVQYVVFCESEDVEIKGKHNRMRRWKWGWGWKWNRRSS